MCASLLTYRRSDLIRRRQGNGYPPLDTILRLKDLKLFRNRSRRGGKNVSRPIKVITTGTRKQRPVEVKEYRHVEVPRLWYDLPSLFMSNVTSLANKMDELIISVQSTCADLVAITECWQIVPELCYIQNYQLFHQLRTDRKGGGVALFSRSNLNPSRLPIIPPAGVEALWVRVPPPLPPSQLSIHHCLCCLPPAAS